MGWLSLSLFIGSHPPFAGLPRRWEQELPGLVRTRLETDPALSPPPSLVKASHKSSLPPRGGETEPIPRWEEWLVHPGWLEVLPTTSADNPHSTHHLVISTRKISSVDTWQRGNNALALNYLKWPLVKHQTMSYSKVKRNSQHKYLPAVSCRVSHVLFKILQWPSALPRGENLTPADST